MSIKEKYKKEKEKIIEVFSKYKDKKASFEDVYKALQGYALIVDHVVDIVNRIETGGHMTIIDDEGHILFTECSECGRRFKEREQLLCEDCADAKERRIDDLEEEAMSLL